MPHLKCSAYWKSDHNLTVSKSNYLRDSYTSYEKKNERNYSASEIFKAIHT